MLTHQVLKLKSKHITLIIIIFAIINQFGIAQANSITEVELEIHELEILNDNDFGTSGEIFITIQINGIDKIRLPGSGDHRSMDDGDIWEVSFKGVFELEDKDILRAEVREDDEGNDVSLGYIEFDQNSDYINFQWISKTDFKILISFTILNDVTSNPQVDDHSPNTLMRTTDTPINIIYIVAGFLSSIVLLRKFRIS